MMKKLLLTSALASIFAFGAGAGTKVTVTPIGERTSEIKKVVSTKDLLVNEDFSAFEWGTDTEPDYETPMDSDGLIDPALTNGQQWLGNNVYSAGGAVAIRTLNPYMPAYISTPQMDYSGAVKVSFMAKYERVEFENEEGDLVHWTGSSIDVYICTPDRDEFVLDKTESDNLANVRLYPDQGWTIVEIEFDNYSSYNDATILFQTDEGVILDDIRVTSTNDDFIAPPSDLEICNVTETSFSVRFAPVRKAFNYYFYLYTLEGYDEAGEPVYMPVLDNETMDFLNMYGMTIQEYIDMAFDGDRYNEYANYGQVEINEPTIFTYADLDPEKDYYYGVRSHYVHTFSDLEIFPMNAIAAPEALDASAVDKESFTANWNGIVKADSYEISLFGTVKAAEDEEGFIVFEEDFSNLSAFSDSDNVYEPTVIDSAETNVTIDDLTTTPGWSTNVKKFIITENALGLVGYSSYLTTPAIYVDNDDYITLVIRGKATQEEGEFGIVFAGAEYTAGYNSSDFEGELQIPTNGLSESTLSLISDPSSDLFIEYIAVTQDVKKDDFVFFYLGKGSAGKDDRSYTFSDLDTESYGMYSYTVKAVRGEGEAAVYSESSNRITVDMSTGTSMGIISGMNDMTDATSLKETARYTVDGRLISAPQKGINIIRYSDGSTRKVVVK